MVGEGGGGIYYYIFKILKIVLVVGGKAAKRFYRVDSQGDLSK